MGHDPERFYYDPTDPDWLMQLALIPTHWLKHLPKKIPTISNAQKHAIKQILNMRDKQPFVQCRGKNWKFVRECEKKGDYSHSDAKHGCEDCRCRHVAGAGTKGNFYGLGPETGHYGVGYCRWCQGLFPPRGIRPSAALRIARRHAEMIQLYGAVSMDPEYELKLVKQEAEVAKQSTKAREELELVLGELKRFQTMLDKTDPENQPTELTKGGPVAMTDKTRIQLNLDIAKTLSRLKLDGLKMDADKYLHVDELTRRIPEMINLVYECFGKLEELIVAKQVRGETVETEQSPQDYVRKILLTGMSRIWRNTKTGRR